jgi:hypothetical protein
MPSDSILLSHGIQVVLRGSQGNYYAGLSIIQNREAQHPSGGEAAKTKIMYLVIIMGDKVFHNLINNKGTMYRIIL